MTLLGCLGCSFIAVGPCLVLFLSSIARNPLKIIVMTAGAFVWLLALLFTSVFWYCFRSLIHHMAPSLIMAIVLQEALRFGLFKLIMLADNTLHKVSTNAQSSENQSLQADVAYSNTEFTNQTDVTVDSRGTGHHLKRTGQRMGILFDTKVMAYVVGLGFALMSCIAQSIQFLLDAYGPGIDIDGWSSRTFFLISAFHVSCVSLMHIFWSIILFIGFERRSYGHIVSVYILRLAVTCLSLVNQLQYPWPEIVSGVYVSMLLSLMVYTHLLAGGRLPTCCFTRANSSSDPLPIS